MRCRPITASALLDNRVGERAHLALGFAEVERAIHFRKDLAAGSVGAASRSGEF